MLQPGDTVDRYVVEAVIGEGGMGRVYRALDPRIGRRVALKVLLAGDGPVSDVAKSRMLREARAAGGFSHPNVVAIHDVGESTTGPFIAMEYVIGSSVRDLLRDGSITWKTKLGWLVDVARGLAAAHRKGLVHRDIKPENVMVTEDGVVKILDFGIARRTEADAEVSAFGRTEENVLPTLTVEGQVIGTPQYMAPEQLRGEPVDGRCDQFAWGVMAWEVLTGRMPWGTATNPAVLVTSVLSAELPRVSDLLPEIPARASDAVAKATSKSRDARFATMDQLVAALEGNERTLSDPVGFAATEAQPAVTTSPSVVAPARSPLATRIETVGWLVAALVWVFGVGYGGHHGRWVFHVAGFTAWGIAAGYVAGAVVLLRGVPLRWLPLVVVMMGAFGSHTGSQVALDYITAHSDAEVAQRFRILHEGLFEAEANRFMAFAFAAALAAASIRLTPKAGTRSELWRRAAASGVAYLWAAVSLVIRVVTEADYAWSSASTTRATRAAAIVATHRALDSLLIALAAGAVIVAAVAWLRARRLRGDVTPRNVVGGDWALVAAAAIGIAADGGLALRFRGAVTSLYTEMAPKLELFDGLTPATRAEDLPGPPTAPTLKLSKGRVAVDSRPVGLVTALDSGQLDAVLLGDLSHALADSTVPTVPPLLVLADQATRPTTLVHALHVAESAGVTKVGLLFLRDLPPKLGPDAPPEAAFAVPSDFGMIVATLERCPETLSDWTVLAQDATVCVGGGRSTRVPEAAERGNYYPCKSTLRPLVEPTVMQACPKTSVAWCGTDGKQVACCGAGLVARGAEGGCECPPGGVDEGGGGCPRSTRTADEERDGIRRTVRANWEPIHGCYEDALTRAKVKGKFTSYFELGPDGRVFFARIHDTDLPDSRAEQCMLDFLRTLTFPPPRNGHADVIYPFFFGEKPD
jgi:serine/threonine-protein kinase